MHADARAGSLPFLKAACPFSRQPWKQLNARLTVIADARGGEVALQGRGLVPAANPVGSKLGDAVAVNAAAVVAGSGKVSLHAPTKAQCTAHGLRQQVGVCNGIVHVFLVHSHLAEAVKPLGGAGAAGGFHLQTALTRAGAAR